MDERALFFQAEELFSGQQWQELSALLDAAESSAPDTAVVWFWRGRAAQARGAADKAVAALEKAVAKDPQTPLFLMHLAQALEMQNAMLFLSTLQENETQLKRIEEVWRKTLELAPESGLYRAAYADFLVGRRRFDEALALICEAKTICPAHEEIHRLWLRINLKLGGHHAVTPGCNLETGLRCLLTVLEELPDLHDALLFAGLCCRKLGRREEAIGYFERCCALAGEGRAEPDPMPFAELAEIFVESGSLDRALETVEKGLRLDPGSPALQGLRDDLNGRMKETTFSARSDVHASPSSASCELQAIDELVRKKTRDVLVGGEARRWVPGLSELFPPGASAAAFWTAALEESFACDDDRFWNRFLTVLEAALERWRSTTDWSVFPVDSLTFWFGRLSQLSHRRIDPESGDLLPSDSAYARAVGCWRDFLAGSSLLSAGGCKTFEQWLLNRCDFWKEELVYYLLHQRPRAFLALLRLVLFVAARLSGFAERCSWLPEIVTGFLARYSTERQAISPESAGTMRTAKEDPGAVIIGWLDDAAASTPGWKPLEEKIRLICAGQAPVAASPAPTLGNEELTIEAVFRFALEEVLADEVVTREETEILRSLRTYLEIPEAQYQQIFRDVADRIRNRQLTRLNRDFSAHEFLYRLLLKTMEDGRVTAEEKMLIKRAAKALAIDQQTFNEQYWRAEAEYRRRLTALSAEDTGNQEEDPVLRRFRKTEKALGTMKKFLRHEHAQDLCTLIHHAIDDLRGRRSADPAQKNVEKCELPVIAFLSWEPAVLPFPVIGLIVPAAWETEALAHLQGTQFDVFVLKNLQELDWTGKRRLSEPVLQIWNADLDLGMVPLETILHGSWRQFSEGLVQKAGEVVLTLVQAETMQPLLAMPIRGGFDATGTLTAVREKLQQRAEDAVVLLKKQLESTPDAFDMRYYLGRAYETLARQGKKPAENLALARRLFDEELERHPSNVKAIAGIGLLYKRAEQWAEAEAFLRRALDLAPANVPILLSLAATVLSRLGVDRKGRPVSEEAFSLLAKAWDLAPRDPDVRALTAEWSRLFRRDLLREFRNRPARLVWP